MRIVKYNPFNNPFELEREFSRVINLFNKDFSLFERDNVNKYANIKPLTDTAEDDDNYYLNIDLPGVKREDVKISYSDGVLSISGERNREKETKKKKSHRIEKSFGKYYRSFSFPKEINVEKINADFKNGQLNITVPKADEVKPKEIDIKVS